MRQYLVIAYQRGREVCRKKVTARTISDADRAFKASTDMKEIDEISTHPCRK